MRKNSPFYQQYRRTIGNHTNWQDKRQGGQQAHYERVQKLARQPGLHTGNMHRQNATHAMVQLLSVLSAAQISSANSAITLQRASELSRRNSTYGGGNSGSQRTERNVPIRDQGGNRPSASARSAMPADSLWPSSFSSANISAINFPSRDKTFSALRRKRSLSSKNIPITSRVYAVMGDGRFGNTLRSTLGDIFRRAKEAPDVKNASAEDKNLFLLLQCIQQLNFYIKDHNIPSTGEAQEMLDALFMIADSLDAPHEKDLVNAFKQRFDSECARSGSMGLLSLQKPVISPGMNSGGGSVVLSPEEKSSRLFNHLLTKARAFYDIDRGALTSDAQKMMVISAFFNQQIFNMSLDEWCMKLEVLKSEPKFCTNEQLGNYVYDRINYYLSKRCQPIEELAFYKNNVLSKSLPTVTLQLSASDNLELNDLIVTQPPWGFVHAGSMLLTDSGAGLKDLDLIDISDVGITLHAMLNARTAPPEYRRYFRLPALLYYVATKPNLPDNSELLERDMEQIYRHYFDYIENWENNNNPLIKFHDLIKGWKTRSGLARKELNSHHLPYNTFLTSYLDSHSEFTIDVVRESRNRYKFRNFHPDPDYKITLLNIDDAFEEQNYKLANALYELDKLLLPSVFNSLSEGEQSFIAGSQVDRVRIQFNALDDIKSVPLALAARRGIERSSALVYRIPDRIDLLQCTLNEEERIYSLKISKATNDYILERVDRDRSMLLWLLDDMGVPMRDPAFKIQVVFHRKLKSSADPTEKLIENLADHHRKRMHIALNEQGYEKTPHDKVSDFMLSLVPFYTCITEGMKGDVEKAITACMIDAINLIPFLGQAASTGIRFGTALTRSTAMALRYGAREVALKGMLKQTGKTLVQLFPAISQEISPQVVQGLGSGFLRSVDPGLGILASSGAKGIRAMGNVLAKIPKKSVGVVKLEVALSKKITGLSPVPDQNSLKIVSLYSPQQGRMLGVTLVGEEGRQIWRQVNRKTGELFGENFILNDKGRLESVSVKLRHQNQRSAEIEGDSKGGASSHEKVSGSMPKVDRIKMIAPGLFSSKHVVKRYIGGSNYIQYYTKLPNNEKSSEVLVLTAHGGYDIEDIDPKWDPPPVKLPSDITIQLLTPHNTMLIDPGLGKIVNAGENLRAYVTITNGEVVKVDFLPQEGRARWLNSDDYDPTNIYNTLGREDGLQNYRHGHFKKDTDSLIAKVLIENRKLAAKGQAVLTDVLAVNKKFSRLSGSSMKSASIQRVIDLDSTGQLLNERGERYKKIVFCHCRSYMAVAKQYISRYYMEPLELKESVPKGSSAGEVILTKLYREDVGKPFEIKDFTVGRFMLTPVKISIQDITTPKNL